MKASCRLAPGLNDCCESGRSSEDWLSGSVLGLAGIAGGIASLAFWWGATFGRLPYDSVLRLVLPSTTALVMSCQIVFGTFFLSILGVRRTRIAFTPAVSAEQDLRSRERESASGHAAASDSGLASCCPPARGTRC